MEENSGDEQLYIPQVADKRKPKIGMKFTSMEEAFSFYNQYAREAGFSARISNSNKNKSTNKIVWKTFVCLEGHTEEVRWHKKGKSVRMKMVRARAEVRTGCNSKISIVKEHDGHNWVVSTFMESHNHPLSTPSKVHLLRSHCNVSATKKALTQQYSESNVPTGQQIQRLEKEHGESDLVDCTERDVRNFEKDLRDEQKEIDTETMIDFFESEKEKSSAFFFDYEVDSDGRFSRCFWADPDSRRAYSAFGDVVVFDMTYNTNKYEMIFALFVGVNHHHQTIFFGGGFLSDEKTKSIIWLLNKLTEAMPKGAPSMIITDQNPTITEAIAIALPRTVHRYSLWHILNKLPHKVHPVNFFYYYQSIKNVIEKSTTSDEFEKSWEEVIKCANLEQNDWLSLMYELRHKWVPAYFKHVFCAGMSSSLRAESSHSFFKRYVSNKNSFVDFITRFNRAIRHQRHNELVADHVDVNEHPKILTNWPLETQMVKLYTKKKFLEFQREMNESHGYYVQQTSIGVELAVYNVMNFQSSSSSKPRVLTHNKQKDYISCSCMKFEIEGIPCRHMLAFFRINQVFQLPDKYILKRWTRVAKVGGKSAIDEQNIIDDPEKLLMARRSRLSYRVSLLIDEASLTEEGTKFLEEQFDYISGKLRLYHRHQ